MQTYSCATFWLCYYSNGVPLNCFKCNDEFNVNTGSKHKMDVNVNTRG